MSLSVTEFDQQTWFKIEHPDALRPFFMSIVSDSNHWMFISSNGGLTAGRKNAQFALFPYTTDDKITDQADITGSKTILHVHTADGLRVWEPFSAWSKSHFQLTRNLYKSEFGNKILFEEVNHDLGLTFRYQWSSSHAYGFVKTSTLENHASATVRVTVLDGLQNLMPYGIESDLQTAASNLADAYKRSELVRETGLGIFALSAIIVDKAEPSEALKANIVWSMGLPKPSYLLSSLQLNRFRTAQPIQPETDIKAERGAYFVNSDIDLPAGATSQWRFVANVNQTHAQIIELNEAIRKGVDLGSLIDADIDRGTRQLKHLVAGADGIQSTSDHLKDSRHYANVMFNIMRGGTFDDHYRIEKRDFLPYLKKASRAVFQRHESRLSDLSDVFDKSTLNQLLASVDDRDLHRLCKEYLPLKFSRRHGDPSRPWNKFSINTFDELDGSKILDYEGNWRDIFQNWETLVHSYPGFIEGMMFKFLNATTFDGYNPYRVTKGGFDWETIEHDNPWSYIGYWGDHQIIYLLKFLEFYKRQQPEGFDSLIRSDAFTYANVPYRIKPYADIARNPKSTIDFDFSADAAIRKHKDIHGADAALLGSGVSEIHHVGFVEKLLATVLSKLSNFIPEGGIWMNTQRPEWNDANNALVGNGVSMVTLYYLRRFLTFFDGMLSESSVTDAALSDELHRFFAQINGILRENESLLGGSISDRDRKAITDALGNAGSDYRTRIYENGFSGVTASVSLADVRAFVRVALNHLEHSIRANRRADRLYHAYNLMSFTTDGIVVSHLSEMLEGQVAVISSGYLSAAEVVDMLDALRNSALYRSDQNSYILYPNKQLPGFLQKNSIPSDAAAKSQLIQRMVAEGNPRIVSRDVLGGFHFNGNFKNADDLRAALDQLAGTEYAMLASAEKDRLLQIFEEVFDHKTFTGRSGTFYAYEGLGSIYWHMVSKLHLAVQEVHMNAVADGASTELLNRLATHYVEIGEGIGIHKTPELYGAFPTDPYSHTPQHRGAQQPGMTGQVKEDILIRFSELGAVVRDGRLSFQPTLLRKDDFLRESSSIDVVSITGATETIALQPGSLAFTYCQVPVVYTIGQHEGVDADFIDGSSRRIDALTLDADTSRKIFARTGEVSRLRVTIAATRLR